MSNFIWDNVSLGEQLDLDNYPTNAYRLLEVNGHHIPDTEHLTARSPRQDGAVFIDTFYLPRDFSLKELVVGGSAAAYKAALVELARLLDPKHDGRLQVTTPVATYTIDARVVSTTPRKVGPFEGEVLFQLRADDPFFKGPEESEAFPSFSGGDVSFSVSNDGHVHAWPVFTIVGPAGPPNGTSIELHNDTTGEVLEIRNGMAGSGENIVVDMGLKTVEQNPGAISIFSVLDGNFWSLVPGTNSLRVVSHNDGTTGEVAWKPAYLAVT